MYCDFCGSKLPYHVRYCRKCGRELKDSFGDTQPIPVIDEIILCNANKQIVSAVPWYKRIFTKKAPVSRSRVWRVFYYLILAAIIGGLLYVFATFQTVNEYQKLTGIAGSLLVIRIWYRIH